MLYRYELMYEGELLNVGFLQGLGDLEFSDDFVKDVTHRFNQDLEIPPCVYKTDSRSFFTEKGIRKFKDEIDKVIGIYHEEDIDVVLMTIPKTEVPKDHILYKDKYQVIVKKLIKGIAYEIVERGMEC